MAKQKRVCDLVKGDVLLFGATEVLNAGRTVRYCVQSDIDPVYLIGFRDGDEPSQIAKSPDDVVLVAE